MGRKKNSLTETLHISRKKLKFVEKSINNCLNSKLIIMHNIEVKDSQVSVIVD